MIATKIAREVCDMYRWYDVYEGSVSAIGEV